MQDHVLKDPVANPHSTVDRIGDFEWYQGITRHRTLTRRENGFVIRRRVCRGVGSN